MKSEICFNCGKKSMKVVKSKPYNYSECGLDNIVLHGITQYECKKCGENYVSIPNMEGLHLTIGKAICCKKRSLLTPQEIKFLRKELHQKSKELARALGVTDTTVSRWENGKSPIHEAQDRFLRSLYMMFVSDQFEKPIRLDAVNLFKGINMKRKTPKSSTKIELNPPDWMANSLDFCSIN